VPKRETIGQRLRRLRTARGLSQRELSSPGVSYAYISRVEADARTPSVKAIRKLADKLGVSAIYLETGAESSIEQGVADAGVEYGSLTAAERRDVEKAADEAAREGAREATKRVLEQRREDEKALLRQRLKELER
jgi:transcriptional regulator with XRE-family HTH domain